MPEDDTGVQHKNSATENRHQNTTAGKSKPPLTKHHWHARARLTHATWGVSSSTRYILTKTDMMNMNITDGQHRTWLQASLNCCLWSVPDAPGKGLHTKHGGLVAQQGSHRNGHEEHDQQPTQNVAAGKSKPPFMKYYWHTWDRLAHTMRRVGSSTRYPWKQTW